MLKNDHDLELIKARIPQREPFLFVDKILSEDREKRTILTSLNLSGEEDFFKGHFPGRPTMPAVLMQEALFQSAAILLSQPENKESGKLGVVTRVQNAKFKKMIIPPTTINMHVEVVEQVSNALYCRGKIEEAGKVICQLEFTVTEVEG